LAMALVWLFAPQYPLAMLPFGVYSVFHVATYTRTNLIPVLQPSPAPAAGASPGAKPTPNALADTIGKFVKEYYDASMGLVAILEILLWGRLFLSALTFAKGSWILIAIYTAFLRARFAQSSFVQGQAGQPRRHASGVEESPGSTGIWCRLTAGGGDPRESATENKPPDSHGQPWATARVKRCGKSAPHPR
jgi:hypothetical protein